MTEGPLPALEDLARRLEERHPSHAAARRELLAWAGRWLGSPGAVHHLLFSGPAGCGKRHLARAVAACLEGRLPVAIASEGSPARPDAGVVLWIARDGAPTRSVPPRTPRLRLRSLSLVEKERVVGDLVREACRHHGLDEAFFAGAEIRRAVRGTSEAGLHGAVRRLDKLCRFAAVQAPGSVEAGAWAREVLGPVDGVSEPLPTALPAGCVHAPIVSSLGGAIARLEAFAVPGNGRTVVTGAGPMAEQAVLVARSRCVLLAPSLGLSVDHLRDLDWHLNVAGPEGPKDGPSLGWPVLVAMVSHLRRTTIDARVAFTGEATLSGEIRAVGGAIEKLLACEGNGIGRLWVPPGNMDELSALDTPVECVALTAMSDAAALREWGLAAPGDLP